MQETSQLLNRNTLASPPQKNRRKPKAANLKKQKSIAKLGMAGSLGALFISGFLKFQGAKTLHLYSGFGLLAFTLWHHLLNQPQTKLKRR